MSADLNQVTLREFIEAVMAERLKRIEENLSQRMDHGDTALDLQATETLRRLVELNHAHDQQVKDKEKFLPRETFEAFQVETKLYRQAAEKDRSELSSRMAAGDARAAAYITAVGLALAALEIGLRLLVR